MYKVYGINTSWPMFDWGGYLGEYLEKYKDMKVYYNPETHELVEKKDAKIKRLRDEIYTKENLIKETKETIECYERRLKLRLELIEGTKEDIEKLEQELKELES